MKKVWLVCLALLLLQGVCWGEGPHKGDKFDQLLDQNRIIMTKNKTTNIGHMFVSCENSSKLFDPAGYWLVDTDFTIEYQPNKSGLNLTMDISYRSDDIYALEPIALVFFENDSITLNRKGKSYYGNKSASAQYELTDPFFQSLIKHKGDIIIRLYYRDLTGQYYEDIKIKEKKVEDIKVLFSLIYPRLNNDPCKWE